MRVVRLTQIGKPLQNVEIPIPEIGPSDVLIRVAAAGICHSDAHYRAGISAIDNLPVTLGHEVAGRVENVGANVANVARAIASVYTIWFTAGAATFAPAV